MRRRSWWLCAVIMVASCGVVVGQEYKVLYSFGANPEDGNSPGGGVVVDSLGRIFGTTQGGGTNGYGTVFELDPSPDGWTETIVYNFCSVGYPNCYDGRIPDGKLLMDSDGNLYGTTFVGGVGTGCPPGSGGVVFKLSPPTAPLGQWTETVLWNFAGAYGCNPNGNLTWDALGNIYGTTRSGGNANLGTVFQLSPSDEGWTETVLYSFCPTLPHCTDGELPIAGVTLDDSGNLYGTTGGGGIRNANGVVFGLFKPMKPGVPWTEKVLHAFIIGKPGTNPQSGVTFDKAGNVYGTVSFAPGGVFKLVPQPGGEWKEYSLILRDGRLPANAPVIAGGMLYGTTNLGGQYSDGTVFKIKGSQATALYSFCSQPNCTDGAYPLGDLTLNGNALYGTASGGGTGTYGGGVVFEISP